MRPNIKPLLASIATLVLAHTSTAADFYWDGNDVSTNADGGAGIWDLVTPNWDDAEVLGGDVTWGNTFADVAIFGGTSGVVTVGSAGVPGETLNVGTLRFLTAGYTIGNVPRDGTLFFGSTTGVLDAPTLGAGDQITINSNLAGTGGLQISGSGATSGAGFLRLAGDNRGLTGGISVLKGGITAASSASFGSNDITLSNGATILATYVPLRLENNFILGTGGGHFRAYTNGHLVLDGVISDGAGASAFTIVDNGLVRLNGTNTYSGPTNIDAGIISFSDIGDTVNGGNLGKGGAIRFNGGTLRYTGGDATTGRSFRQPGNGTIDIVYADTTFTHTGNMGDGQSGRFLNKTGAGTLVLGGNTDNSGGRFRINRGTLVLAKESASSVHAIGSNGNSDLGLVMNGGKVILSGTGGDQIYIKTSVQINAGTFDMNGLSEGFDSLSGAGGEITNSVAGYSVLTLGESDNLGNANNNFAGAIRDGAGIVSLVKTGSGRQILSGRNTYTGPTIITSGTLEIGNGGSLGNTEIANDGILSVASKGGVVISSPISGFGSVTKSGSGVLTLSGDNTYFGDTTVSDGALNLTGTLLSNITVGAGAVLAGSGSTNGTVTLQDGSFLIGGSSSLTANGVVAEMDFVGVNVLIAGTQMGSNTYDVIRYGDGLVPEIGNFSTLPYRPGAVFSNDISNKKVTLTYTADSKTWTADASWYIGAGGWGGDDNMFFTGDSVTFGDIEADSLVFVDSIVAPSAFTVTNSANTLTFAGTGTIAGLEGLTKTGAGTLQIQTNNAYAGQTIIEEGVLKVGHNSALGATGVGNETIIRPGATLDLNGGVGENGLTLDPEIIQIAGTGVGGAGALVNTGPIQQNALSYVTLIDDASVGGTQRFDIRNTVVGSPVLDLNGHTLTKVGTNNFVLVSTTITPGDIVVASGTFQPEAHTTTLGEGTVTVEGGASFGLWGNTGGFNWPITLKQASRINNAGSDAVLSSDIILDASANLNADNSANLRGSNTTMLLGNISGTGSLTKTDAGTYVLAGDNTYEGYTLIRGGTLRVGSDNALPETTRVVLWSASTPTLDINGFNVTVASLQSGGESDTAAVVNLGAEGHLTVLGNGGASGVGNVAGRLYARITGIGDIEYNNLANATGTWDWENPANEFVGDTTITSGRLRFRAVAGETDTTALGNPDNDIIFNGDIVDTLNNQGGRASIQVTNGSVVNTANLAPTRDFILNDGKEGTFYVWGSTTFTVNGQVTGGGNLRKEDGGTLVLTNPANDYTGETRVVNGRLRLGATGALPAASLVRVGSVGGITPVLDLAGFNATIAGLTSVQPSDNSVRTDGQVTSASAADLVIVSDEDHIYGGVISGSISVTKDGSGEQTFAGANSYTGDTSVLDGALFVTNTSGSGTGSGDVDVSAGATLGGTGIIAPTGTNGVSVSGILAPGVNSTGALTVNLGATSGTFSLENATFKFDLGTAGIEINDHGVSDVLVISGASPGDVVFSQNTIDFGGTGEEGWYKLFESDGGFATWSGLTIGASNYIDSGLEVTNLGPGLAGFLRVGDGTSGVAGDIYLQVIPEPTGVSLLLGGLTVAFGMRRRRRSQDAR